MAWQRNFRRELYEEFLSPGGLPGLKETTLLDPQGWRHLTRSEVEFAAKYALWLSFRDWGNFFSWVVKAGVGEEDKKDAASSGQSPSLSNKDSGGVEPPLVTAAQLQDLTQRAGTQIRALASSEDLQGRLLSLGATSELKARLASLGSEGLHLTRDCLDEFLKGYEVSSARVGDLHGRNIYLCIHTLTIFSHFFLPTPFFLSHLRMGRVSRYESTLRRRQQGRRRKS